MDIYDVVPRLTPKLRNKTLKINNLRHMAQNWTSIVKYSYIFSKFCLYIYKSYNSLKKSCD